MVLWVGGIVFFGVMTYVAFTQLGSVHLAGVMVRGTLRLLHTIGLACGALFLLASAIMWAAVRRRLTTRLRRLMMVSSVLVTVMFALTAYSAAVVLPRMEADRIALGGEIAEAPPGAPAAAEFQRLHETSVRLETGVLIGGLLVLLAIAAEEHGRAAEPGRIVST
jgi:hypothetical protein